MFEKLIKVFNMPESANPILQKDAIAELLRISPEALEAFETAYAAHALNEESDNFFQVNSRQAVNAQHAIDPEKTGEPIDEIEYFESLCSRIVDELLAQTETYVFDGNLAKVKPILHFLPELQWSAMKISIACPNASALSWLAT